MIGLEINWDDKDGPLTQIGKGTDATKFGWIVKGPDDILSFTSRDWIFIKECINGSPLTFPDAPTDQTDFVGRTQEKEFLYDIVNNRHNGLDVDKIDYYARDYLAAKGMKNLDILMLEEAVVAWGHCPNHKKCFKCKAKSEPDKHLMMCYPDKFVANAMHFYAQRMKNHREVVSMFVPLFPPVAIDSRLTPLVRNSIGFYSTGIKNQKALNVSCWHFI